MAILRAGLAWLFVCGIVTGSALALAAAAAEAEDSSAAMVGEVQLNLARSFQLPEELALDPGLRTEAESIAAAHLLRVQQLLPVWVAEERRLQAGKDGKARDTDVFFAVFARVLNELALWQLEPGDAAYEKATLEVLTASPTVCRIPGDPRFSDFANRIARIQAMPTGQRQAALAAERRLLEHWGKPRRAPPARPATFPQQAAMAAIAQIQAGGERPPLALSPALASELLAKRTGYEDLAAESQCNLKRWWLRVSLAQGESPETALTAFRYGTLISAMDRYGQAFEAKAGRTSKTAPGGPPGYPALAARFDVTGVTRVSRRFDATGKPIEANVVERKIAVRGIRDVRPVAFENTFDTLAVHYALQGGDGGKPGAPLPPVFEMVWSLDAQKGNKP